MISVLLALSLTMLCGAAVARVTRSPLTLSFLYGSGLVWAVMLILPWKALPIGGALAAIAALCFFISRGGPAVQHPLKLSAIDAATALLLGVFAFFATAAALWEWDAWAIWALKARVFFEYRGIDWAFLQRDTNAFAHPSYPLLFPLNLALPAVLSGEWSDRWLGLYSVLFAGSAAIAVRFIMAEARSRHLSATLAFATMGLAASRYVGTAETPFIALSVCGLLLLRNGQVTPAALLLALAGSTKTEGLTLLLAAAAGLVASGRRRDVLGLWPAALIALPWIVLQALHGLQNRIVAGATSAAILERVSDGRSAFVSLARHTDLPWLSIAILVSIPFVIRKERLLLVTAGVQLAAFLAAYAVTPFDLEWHIATSWERLSRQLLAIAVPATLLGLEAMFRSQGEAREATNGEARAEEPPSLTVCPFSDLPAGERA